MGIYTDKMKFNDSWKSYLSFLLSLRIFFVTPLKLLPSVFFPDSPQEKSPEILPPPTCFCLLQQDITRSHVHHSASASSSPTTMGEPCSWPPVHAASSWQKRGALHLENECKKTSPDGPRQMEKTIGLLRGLQ